MCQSNNNIKDWKKQHITKEDRILIEHLYNILGLNISKIASQLKPSRSAISREIKRGLVDNLNSDLSNKKVYSATIGQRKHDFYGSSKGPALKIKKDNKVSQYIKDEIANKRSPEVISNELNDKKRFDTQLSFKTIYNYIDKDILGVVRNDLTYGNYKLKIKKRKEGDPIRALNKEGRRIKDRLEEVENREIVNHWEMDTFEGIKGEKEPVLLVLSERASCREIIILMENKKQISVEKALNMLERKMGSKQFRETFKTITTDNGSEFLDYSKIEKSCINKSKSRTKQYYADPYSPWQRGTNENINKMIRRFLPKGKSFKDITVEEVKEIEDWINNYPRKKFGFRTANEVYIEKNNGITFL